MSTTDNLHFWRIFHSFLRHDNGEDEVARTRATTSWLAENFGKLKATMLGDELFFLNTVLRYSQDHGGMPTANMVKEIVEQEPKNEGLLADFDNYTELAKHLTAYDAVDLNQLLVEKELRYRTDRLEVILGLAGKILNVGHEDRKTKRTWTGPDDALEFLRKKITAMAPKSSELGGLLHMHTEEMVRHLKSGFLDAVDERRCLTLIPAIDQSVVIGLDGLKFVGIAGQSSHGKSLLLNSLVYNFLLQSKNVLYVSLEHDALDIWTKMAFLHADCFQENFVLPPLQEFLLGRQAQRPPSVQDWQNVETLRRDIEERGGLPGTLDVQTSLRSWDEVTAYAEARQPEQNYSAVVVDYLEHLNADGVDPRFHNEAFKQTIKQAHSLTKSFDKGRGVVLISPVPVTKEAAKIAEFDPHNPEKPFDITAVRGASQFIYSLDLLLGIWSDDNLKMSNEMVVFGLKSRQGNLVPLTICHVDAINKRLAEKVGVTVRELQLESKLPAVHNALYPERDHTVTEEPISPNFDFEERGN